MRANIPTSLLRWATAAQTLAATAVSSPPVGGLNGKKAIVTGASSGIGAATARALEAEGATVAVGARRLDRLAELGDDFIALELDVSDPDSAASFVTSAVHRLDGLDILVNNAGLALGRDLFDESSEGDEEIVLETNVHGLIRMTRLCLPHPRDGGHVVNIGSVAGRQAYERGALYVTSKFAVRGFTYALREDLLGRPIRVTTVDPGLVETSFSRVRYRGDEEAAAKVYEGVEPLRPEDIADCVVFAVSRPQRVNVDEIVVKALAQTSGARILRRS
jgi:3-hydroxy acid dehydrogenase / malonic semialdehyde reductase